MKRGLFLLFLILTSSICFSSGKGDSSEEAGNTITLKMGHFASETHAGNIASKMFAEAVESRTKGLIRISIFPSNQLGSPPEVLEQNILGDIDMSLPSQGQLARYSKKFGCVMLPFVFENYEQAYQTLDGPFMDWAGPDIEEQGLVFLSNWEWGFRYLTNSVRPIHSPEDVEGLTIRTPPELANQLSMEALGATVQTIAWPELSMALKQGVVDGQENPVSVIHALKIYETQKYMTMTGHTYNGMVHVISKKTWDKLTSQQQQIIREESIVAGNFMRKSLQEAELEQLQELEDLGMEIFWPDVAEFKAYMGPAYKQMAVILGHENLDTFLSMVEQFR